MVEQSDFPEKWSCSSANKRVVVELRVPDDSDPTGYTWIEIPTQSVEHWIEKGEAAQIQRTAKVRFPTEWGENTPQVDHNSPKQLVEQYDSDDASPFMMARIWWQDYSGEWVLQHFGWVGGVGPTGQVGLSKLWVYDLAELLSGVPIGETFRNPSVQQSLEVISRLTNDNTPIPLSEVIIMPPRTEEEYLKLADSFDAPADPLFTDVVSDDDDEGLVGPRGSGPNGHAYYSLSESRFVSPAAIRQEEGVEGLEGLDIIGLPKDPEENFTALRLSTGDIPVANLDAKSFVSNHDTLLDVYDWFESKTEANLHFEPLTESVALVADIVPERRVFAQREVAEQYEEEGIAYSFHDITEVIENDALYEMKPLNTLHLRGSTQSGLLDDTKDFLQGAFESLTYVAPPPADTYPVVKVQVPELVEAAEGTELSGEVVESDAEQLDNAVREAKRRLSDKLEETTEGEIILNGTPRMMPYDRLDAFEVCGEQVQYEEQPVKYEVESVKHEKTASDVYKTRIKVSVWANNENIETVRKTMVEVEA